MGGARWRSIALVSVASTVAVAGCSTGTASYDDAVAITAPTFAPTPANPADSPQLDALQLRDTAGLAPPGPNADPAVLGPALADLATAAPGVDRISDLYFDDESVWLTIIDPDSPSRTRGVYWSKDSGLSIGEPQFLDDDDDPMFPVSAVRPAAVAALVEGLAERYPTLQIEMPRLSSQLSYDLGLSWRMDLVDARGTLAIVFADLDGTVTVLDQDQGQD